MDEHVAWITDTHLLGDTWVPTQMMTKRSDSRAQDGRGQGGRRTELTLTSKNATPSSHNSYQLKLRIAFWYVQVQGRTIFAHCCVAV